MHNKIITNKNYLLILFCFVVYIITAFNSLGFYNDDEHFQILEPIAYLLGLNTVLINDPLGYYWEWQTAHRIRPWLQPYFYYQIVLFLKFLNINDPHTWVLTLRLFTAVLGFISIIYLFFSIKKYFVKEEKFYHYIIYFTFWFYPFLNVRTSSENLSLILFCFAFPYLLEYFNKIEKKINLKNTIFFSFILGLSIVVRPQIIFTIFPIFLWVLAFKFNLYKIILVIWGCLLAIILGLYIDFINWGYFTNTYWQVFEVQILKGRMAAFGAQPLWYYFEAILLELAPISSLFFMLSVILFSYRNIKSVFIWITLGTLIILMFFEHKEVRFFFPAYVFAPFFLMYFFDNIKNYILKRILISLCLISNLVFLLIVSLVPINGKVPVYKYLYSLGKIEEQIFYVGENPYQMNEMEPFFYTSFIPKIKEIKNLKIKERSYIITNEYSKKITLDKYNNCRLVFSSYPLLIELNENWKNKKLNWYVNLCEPQL